MRTTIFKLAWRASAGQRLLALLGVIVAALVLMGAVAGCSVQSEKKSDGKAEKVDIDTPFFSASVRRNVAEAKQTGLPEYPGARRQTQHDDDTESANVSFQSGGFDLKVVAIRYESDDPQEKVLDFYRKAMKAMGNVVECKGDIDIDVDKHGADEKREPGCKADRDHSDKVELAVRAGAGNRVVSTRPKDKGTEFQLLYIQTRGSDNTI